ncbi:Cyclic-di-GMP-binding biofilm dispersal mediator protein [Streptomyces sp. MH192]|uniref:3-oxoacyl-ACP reductase FabG n=2 Tax=Streptomyces griseoaurantiacus TaxID=68213 RepID=A0A7W2DZX6_9ACTN|nr:3-oxoacyl-ACP reductase FabG [Streptomyces griseoaurantiacus]MCF0088302.1 Cyclic-di-GMP-binding biofilm dispersal mediator protein [Streptomyces sp. MH192]MCF0100553.1 Cyclic-di-GMP-binding biofilm dispersal mediator protein [Streptomyces sp. MH191]
MLGGMNRLEGNVALITGGGRGIGAAVAVRLAEEGADVVLTYENSADRAAGVVEHIKAGGRRAVALRADSANPAALTAAVDEAAALFGRLDILVNNAGVFPVGPLEEVELAELDRTLAVNVRAPFLASQAAVRHMGRGGRIISIGSNIAQRAVFPEMALYSMSKSALTGMTKGLARELGPRGITVNLVHPGPTNTDANPSTGPHAQAIAGLTAVGRYAEPHEIAATIAHLASPDAQYTTGTSLHVDGGFTA